MQCVGVFSVLHRRLDKSISQSAFGFWQLAQFMSDCLFFDFPLFTSPHTSRLICLALVIFRTPFLFFLQSIMSETEIWLVA